METPSAGAGEKGSTLRQHCRSWSAVGVVHLSIQPRGPPCCALTFTNAARAMTLSRVTHEHDRVGGLKRAERTVQGRD